MKENKKETLILYHILHTDIHTYIHSLIHTAAATSPDVYNGLIMKIAFTALLFKLKLCSHAATEIQNFEILK